MSSRESRPDLRAALDAATPPRARTAFKAQLAEQFLSGRFETTEDEVPTLEAWEVPAARPEFREELRARFLGVDETSQPLAPVVSIYRYMLAAAVAAAIVLLWVAPWNAQPADGWRSVAFDEFEVTPVVSIDGRSVEYRDDASLDRALSQGCRLETMTEPLTVMRLEEGVLLEVEKATRLDITRTDSMDSGLGLEFYVESGALRVATRPEFVGSIHVRTPDALIALSGSSLGVDVLDAGTCLCILEGQATMTATDGSDERQVPTNSTAFYYRDGRAGILMEGEVHHDESLLGLLATGEAYLY